MGGRGFSTAARKFFLDAVFNRIVQHAPNLRTVRSVLSRSAGTTGASRRSRLSGRSPATALRYAAPRAKVPFAMLRALLGLHFVLWACLGFAAELEGIVTDVHDGDTITLVNWQYSPYTYFGAAATPKTG